MGFVVGLVAVLESVAGKDKLSKLTVDVGAAEQLTIVTNASNVSEGSRVVVAMLGTELSDGTVVKKASVGGVVSEGMLCDAPMLSWVGGGAGAAAIVPDSFAPGDAPPASRPRMDLPKAETPAMPAVEVKPLFEKKLTKEEKKAAAAAKKAERAAKKAAAGGESGAAADDDGEDAE
jgi:tRNA-binding EMAP/Myf-like protein